MTLMSGLGYDLAMSWLCLVSAQMKIDIIGTVINAIQSGQEDLRILSYFFLLLYCEALSLPADLLQLGNRQAKCKGIPSKGSCH